MHTGAFIFSTHLPLQAGRTDHGKMEFLTVSVLHKLAERPGMLKAMERQSKGRKEEREREQRERNKRRGWDVGGFLLAAVQKFDRVYRFNCGGNRAIISRRELERRALRNTKLAPGPPSASQTHKNSKRVIVRKH